MYKPTLNGQRVLDLIGSSIEPLPSSTIADALDLPAASVRGYCRTFMKHGLLYIAQYVREPKHIVPYYACGNLPNAVRPPPYTPVEVVVRYRKMNPQLVKLQRVRRYARLRGRPVPQTIELGLLSNFKSVYR